MALIAHSHLVIKGKVVLRARNLSQIVLLNAVGLCLVRVPPKQRDGVIIAVYGDGFAGAGVGGKGLDDSFVRLVVGSERNAACEQAKQGDKGGGFQGVRTVVSDERIEETVVRRIFRCARPCQLVALLLAAPCTLLPVGRKKVKIFSLTAKSTMPYW